MSLGAYDGTPDFAGNSGTVPPDITATGTTNIVLPAPRFRVLRGIACLRCLPWPRKNPEHSIGCSI
jgi:hypothetical protein